MRGIVAIGNPALWWASVPVTRVGARHRHPRARPAADLLRARLLLPVPAWGISPRTLNYSHYLFEAIPYACLSLGMLLDRHWDAPAARLARGYLVLVVALFLFFFPFLVALPVPASWYFYSFRGVRPWTWFPTWV